MVKFLLSTAAYLIANAVGLLVAVIILPGFKIGVSSFVLAVLIFSVLQTVAGPLLTKLSLKQFPQLTGGIALVTILFGLIVTDLLMSQMEVGGISNLLAALASCLDRQSYCVNPYPDLCLQTASRRCGPSP